MKPKLRIISIGSATYVELDGKTIGRGVECIRFHHEGDDDARLRLDINLREFSFLPDGYLEEVEKKMAKVNPPEDQLDGRID